MIKLACASLTTIAVILGIIFLRHQGIHVQTPTNMVRCDESSTILKKDLSDTLGTNYSLYWTENASKDCPGAGFPRIVLDHPQVKYWVQIIKANVPVEYLNGSTSGWMESLPSADGDLIWLDIPKGHREQKNPYYNSVPQGIFHDNPGWGLLPKNSQIKRLVWRAYLYGFATSEITQKPLIQLVWGFDLIAGKGAPVAIEPRKTSVKMLVKFMQSWRSR